MGYTYTLFRQALDTLFTEANTISVNLISYNVTGDDYDDQIVQTKTGSSWVSGVYFPVRSKMGSDEALLLQQGKINMQDKVLYIKGESNINSSGLLIGLGSPVTDYYTLIPNGVHTYEVNGSPVYKKLFLRTTIPGSIF